MATIKEMINDSALLGVNQAKIIFLIVKVILTISLESVLMSGSNNCPSVVCWCIQGTCDTQ